ncbi:hypothetical protein PR003_g9767 [Phytophthora rubi]|uniref:Uncharacterized protein n=1 Tax=Phytophthora rubi TaxID=129364 RepID=A0A6A4FTB2_9STRA|nr:hypothetical protein PR003_g9767 [Phytophthora rubi]
MLLDPMGPSSLLLNIFAAFVVAFILHEKSSPDEVLEEIAFAEFE